MRELVVTRLSLEAQDIIGIELRDPHGKPLPPFTAGAHVDIHLPHSVVRQYSLSNAPSERDRYCLGVAHATASRGGSSYVHRDLRIGQRVGVDEPRNLFGLSVGTTRHRFVAGGIGITPIRSMIFECEARGMEWRLFYAVRNRSRAAYLDDLLALDPARVHLHADDEHGGKPLDVAQALSDVGTDEHVYCCGPSPLMDGVANYARSSGWQARTHFERFGAPVVVSGGSAPSADTPFTVRLARRGVDLQVPVGKSILSVLEDNGVSVPSSCREGLCRTCEVPVLAGAPGHRDYVLSDSEREGNRSIMICVSRSCSNELVLDL